MVKWQLSVKFQTGKPPFSRLRSVLRVNPPGLVRAELHRLHPPPPPPTQPSWTEIATCTYFPHTAAGALEERGGWGILIYTVMEAWKSKLHHLLNCSACAFVNSSICTQRTVTTQICQYFRILILSLWLLPYFIGHKNNFQLKKFLWKITKLLVMTIAFCYTRYLFYGYNVQNVGLWVIQRTLKKPRKKWRYKKISQ